MDKRVIFAVAGSGKTTRIINSLSLERRSLIVTYTVENTKNLEFSIKKKFGYIPPNITLMTYFTFLHSFCFKPFFAYKLRPTGIEWEFPSLWETTRNKNDFKHYITENGFVYANRLAKLLVVKNTVVDIRHRLEKYFDNFFIDEVQDFAANDFNLLIELAKTNIEILLVGDFYQHTFDTSRDANIQKNLHKDYNKYIQKFKNAGITPDIKTLSNSYRCSPVTCDFISSNFGISISAHNDKETRICFIDNQEQADELYSNDTVVKLFYENASKYDCYSNNWGKSKGNDFYEDVCVVLNNVSTKLFKRKKLIESNPKTLNKLYVACSRAKGDLIFVPESFYKKYKAE